MVANVGSQTLSLLGNPQILPCIKIRSWCLQNTGMLWGKALQEDGSGWICTWGASQM